MKGQNLYIGINNLWKICIVFMIKVNYEKFEGIRYKRKKVYNI